MNGLLHSDSLLRVEQSLHGYHRGHGLIASSFGFDKKTSAMLSSISDASLLGYSDPEPSYLTGYPIPELSCYAVARTWPAGEMSRPGCVWTHTVYIDYSDLARCSSLVFLKDIFIRPDKNKDFSDYKIALEIRRDILPVLEINKSEFFQIRSQLYGSTSQVVLPWKESSELSMLQIWSQQWPKLRRSLRFRTYGSKGTGNEKFDVLFIRSKPTQSVDQSGIENKIELLKTDTSLSYDLLELNQDFKEFIWRYGADFDYTREAYIPIRKLWQLWRNESNLEKTLKYLTTEMKEVPRSLATEVIRSYLDHCDENDSSVDMVYSLLARIRISDLTNQEIEVLAERLSVLSTIKLAEILHSYTSHNHLISILLSEISIVRKIELIKSAPDLVDAIVIYSPAVLNEVEFWRTIDNEHVPWEKIKESGEIDLEKVLLAAIKAQELNAIDKIVDVFEVKGMLALLSACDEVMSEITLSRVLDRITRNKKLTLVALRQSEGLSLKFMDILSNWFRPQDEHTGIDAECWYAAIASSHEHLGVLFSNLSCFVLIKGLLSDTVDSLKLISISFDSVHALLSRSGIGSKYWDTLNFYLPNTNSFFEWDRCQRLRKGVIKKFYGKNEALGLFLNMARSRWSFEELVETASSFDEGRALLRAVANSNLATDDQLAYIMEKL